MTTAHPPTARGLLGNSIALLAMTHITSLLGYVFWVICARHVSASVIGITNTVVSAMSLVAVLTVAGFIPLLTRVLPGASSEERSGLCSTAFAVTIVVSGMAGVAGALLLPKRLHAEVGTDWLVALLGAGAVGTAMLLVVSAALLGVRRAELSLLGNVTGSLLRLVIVAALLFCGVVAAGADASAAHTILTVWVASLMIASGLSVLLLARATPGFRFRPGRMWLSRLRRPVAWDHVATLAGRSPLYVVPILAFVLFPPAQVGYLAMAGTISGAFFAVAASVSNALLADCADGPERLRAQARRALRLIGGLLIPPVVIASLLAPKVLGLFGADYAHHSALLVLLLLSTFPDALINVAVAMLRVQRRLVAVAAVTVAGATITIGGSWLLMPHLGIIGAGWAALAAPVIVTITLAVMWFRRSLISGRSVDGADGLLARVADEPSADLAAAGTSRVRKIRIGRS
jgi:O-antigen/teichoic acid export membrane protein